MGASLPLMTSALVQRLASWASFVPPFRRAAYEIAGMAFMRRHVCRLADFPRTLCQDYRARNQHVYETMWGPSEFFATGVLADWNVEPRLGEITVPTLLLSGRYDEATPAQQERLRDGIPGSWWTILEHSAHLTFVEEPQSVLRGAGVIPGRCRSERQPVSARAYPRGRRECGVCLAVLDGREELG